MGYGQPPSHPLPNYGRRSANGKGAEQGEGLLVPKSRNWTSEQRSPLRTRGNDIGVGFFKRQGRLKVKEGVV